MLALLSFGAYRASLTMSTSPRSVKMALEKSAYSCGMRLKVSVAHGFPEDRAQDLLLAPTAVKVA